MTARLAAARELARDLLDYALVSAAITCGAVAVVLVFVGIPAWVVVWVVSQ